MELLGPVEKSPPPDYFKQPQATDKAPLNAVVWKKDINIISYFKDKCRQAHWQLGA